MHAGQTKSLSGKSRQMHDLFIANRLCWRHGIYGDDLYNAFIKFGNIIVADLSVKTLRNEQTCIFVYPFTTVQFVAQKKRKTFLYHHAALIDHLKISSDDKNEATSKDFYLKF